MIEIKVESGIPLPTGHTGSIRSTLIAMKPGESFVVQSANTRMYASNVARTHGFKVVTRKENDGFRIWRKS